MRVTKRDIENANFIAESEHRTGKAMRRRKWSTDLEHLRCGPCKAVCYYGVYFSECPGQFMADLMEVTRCDVRCIEGGAWRACEMFYPNGNDLLAKEGRNPVSAVLEHARAVIEAENAT